MNMFKAFGVFMIINILGSLALLGFVIWVIVKVMQHFQII